MPGSALCPSHATALPKTSWWWKPWLFQPKFLLCTGSAALAGSTVQTAPLLPHASRPAPPSSDPSSPGIPPAQLCSPRCLFAVGGSLRLRLPRWSTSVLPKLRFVPTLISFFSVWVTPAEKTPLFSYKNLAVSFSRLPKGFSVGAPLLFLLPPSALSLCHCVFPPES